MLSAYLSLSLVSATGIYSIQPCVEPFQSLHEGVLKGEPQLRIDGGSIVFDNDNANAFKDVDITQSRT